MVKCRTMSNQIKFIRHKWTAQCNLCLPIKIKPKRRIKTNKNIYTNEQNTSASILSKPAGTLVAYHNEKIVNVWNDLPSTDNFASLASFKRTIRDVDFCQYVRCCQFDF